jgi:hypothetical protein
MTDNTPHGEELRDLNPQEARGDRVSEPVTETGEYTPPAYTGRTKVSERVERPLLPPLRFVFGEVWGIVFLIWLPILILFFFPWTIIGQNEAVVGSLKLHQLLFALVIALPPWIVLIVHLVRGRLWDGILDMFLWAIWESFIMLILCYLYPERASSVIWNASSYWDEMRHWIATGKGAEGDPSVWLLIHLKHLIMLIIGAIVFGLPALLMGVLQLNYMNYYVARCALLSDNPLLTVFTAWHFWSVIRVAGFIILASSFFHMILRLFFRVRWSGAAFGFGLFYGFLFIFFDGLLKWLYADTVRELLVHLTHL